MSPYKMIYEVMENFNFDQVQSVMEHLDWRWAGTNYRVPDREQLERQAHSLLVDAIEVAEKEPFEHEGIPYFSSTGGFKATALKGKNNRVNFIQLEFVLEQWEHSADE